MRHHLALVMLFEGESPKGETLAKIGAFLKQEANVAGDIDAIIVDPKEIVTSIMLKKGISELLDVTIEDISSAGTKYTPEENAAILVGEKMKEYLGPDYTKNTFAIGLVNKIGEAKKHPNNRINKAFMNALFILSQPDLSISPKILTKSKLNTERIATICDIYNLLSNE